MAEWSRYCTLDHEIMGSSPAIHLVFCAYSPWARFVPQMYLEVIVNMQSLACREPHKIYQSLKEKKTHTEQLMQVLQQGVLPTLHDLWGDDILTRGLAGRQTVYGLTQLLLSCLYV